MKKLSLSRNLWFVVFPFGLLLASCASSPKTARNVSSVDEAIFCRTSGIMDSGYAVTIQPGDMASLQGQVTTIASWGADQSLYKGPFSLEILPNSGGKTCYAKIKSVAKAGGEGVNANNAPVIEASADGQKAVLTLAQDGTPHDVRCQWPKKVVETLRDCQAALAKTSNQAQK